MTWEYRLRPCGEHAVLVELAGLDEVQALRSVIEQAVAAREEGLGGVSDVVPAARTVLVVLTEAAPVARLSAALPGLVARAVRDAAAPGGPEPGEPERVGPERGEPEKVGPGSLVTIPVRYDGADLAEVGRLTGLGSSGVVAAHTGTEWQVAFGGFAPGFGYLAGGDPRLAVPRRAEPRTSVPAGSVALAGGYSAVYPRASPGGWQLIGYTDLTLFDPRRDPPALLRPGVRVRFVDAGTSR